MVIELWQDEDLNENSAVTRKQEVNFSKYQRQLAKPVSGHKLKRK